MKIIMTKNEIKEALNNNAKMDAMIAENIGIKGENLTDEMVTEMLNNMPQFHGNVISCVDTGDEYIINVDVNTINQTLMKPMMKYLPGIINAVKTVISFIKPMVEDVNNAMTKLVEAEMAADKEWKEKHSN